jgi:signal transduction histidine kinase
VLPLVRPTAAHLHVALQATLPESPIRVRGDENGLSQLVVNLTLNAIEAASGPSRTSPHEPAVEVRVLVDANNRNTARLEVLDSGPGPAADVQDRLFEPLVSDKPDGAGLGLPVAQEIARLHGGELGWERRGEQTCFFVELPVLVGEAKRAATVGG